MRIIIIFLLLYSTAYAQPFLKCDCDEYTDILIVNGINQQCPLSLDVEYLPVGLNDFIAIPVGSIVGNPFTFKIRKTDLNKNYTYKIEYDKEDKVYFNTKEILIRIDKGE